MTRMTSTALVIALLLTPDAGRAQTSTPGLPSIPVRFEILKNGAKVATIAASVTAGSTGAIEMDGISSLTFTPTMPSADTVMVAFSFVSAGQVARPRVVLRGGSQGSILLKSESGDLIEVRVSSSR